MAICCALSKHDYSNFSLTILEYCEVSDLLIREKYYWDIFNPEYNISKDHSAPMSGRTHSDASKIIMSDAKKIHNPGRFKTGVTGKNHPMFGKNHTDETKKIMSDNRKGKPKIEGSGSSSQQIEVTDIQNNTTISYDSISEAARVLNINKSRISEYFSNNQQKPYKGQYIFKKI